MANRVVIILIALAIAAGAGAMYMLRGEGKSSSNAAALGQTLFPQLKAADVTLLTPRLKVTFHDTVVVMAVCVHAVAQVMAVTPVAGVV